MKNKHIFNIAISALFCAIICILSQVAINIQPLPFTLQIFGVALCGYLLNTKLALFSVLGYILLGSIGIPVFAGFKGGVHALFGFSGGFIIGFIALALFCSLATKFKSIPLKILFSFIGLALCHILGTVWLSVVSDVNLLSAFLTASLPFVLKDVILIFAAFLLAKVIKKRIHIFE